MTADVDLERRLTDWFAAEAPARASHRLLDATMMGVDRTPQVRPVAGRLGAGWSTLSARRRVLLVAAVVAALTGAVVVAGAVLLHKPLVADQPRLLVVRPVGGPAVDSGVAVVAIAKDGTEETIATFGNEQLGGSWTGDTVTYSGDGRLSVPTSVGAADNQFAVVDLREPAAAPRFPDAVGHVATWRPDGRLAYDANDGTIAVYDVGTGVTSRIGTTDGDPPLRALDPVDVGLGPRRDRDDGTRLGEPIDVESSHPDLRLTDYASARDGGRWLLFETRGDGPSTIHLLHVARDGTERDLTRFGIDAPESAGYPQNGSFVAIAPDDSRFVVTTKQGESTGPPLLIDPTTGQTIEQVEGMIVGWLGPDDLTKPRGAEQPIAAAPAAVRGEWARIIDPDRAGIKSGIHRVRLGYTTAVLDPGTDAAITLAITADGPDRLQFTQPDRGLGCEAGTATYRWRTAGGGLTFKAESDRCVDRQALLEGRFDHNLPYRGNWEPVVAAGQPFLVAELEIRLTIPATGDAHVWDHSDIAISLSNGDPNLWAIGRVDRRAPAPSDCGEPAITGGLDGVLAYLDTLKASGITLEDRTATTAAGLPALRGTLRLPLDSDGICGRWPMHAGGWAVRDGESITLIEAPGGRVYSLLTRGDATWADALTGSLEFVQAEPRP